MFFRRQVEVALAETGVHQVARKIILYQNIQAHKNPYRAPTALEVGRQEWRGGFSFLLVSGPAG